MKNTMISLAALSLAMVVSTSAIAQEAQTDSVEASQLSAQMDFREHGDRGDRGDRGHDHDHDGGGIFGHLRLVRCESVGRSRFGWVRASGESLIEYQAVKIALKNCDRQGGFDCRITHCFR